MELVGRSMPRLSLDGRGLTAGQLELHIPAVTVTANLVTV